jgi:WS/DGAT/MGAT family acyltransferase
MAEQLTGLDAAFLALETPDLPMHVVGVMLLDPAAGTGFAPARVREVVAERLHLMPPFCRRLVDVPLSLDRPYWHYDVDVDLSQHVFTASLPFPGDLRALGAFVGEVAGRLLDRGRPLWELHVVDGLSDGRVALVSKVHHATLYGAAGADFIAELLDFGPEAREIAPPTGAEPADLPDAATLMGRTLVNQLRWPLVAGRLSLSAGRNSLDTVRAFGRIVSRHGRAALPFTAPRTAISGAATARRAAAFSALPLDLAQGVKDAAGVKLNDVVLAVVTLAVRDYLEQRDAVPGRPLVASCPLNVGDGESAGTNVLSAMLVPLPMEDLPPADLLLRVHDATVAAKEFTTVVGRTAIADLADVTPPAAVSLAARLGHGLRLAAVPPPMQNLVVSNVVGPPLSLYLAGARVDAIYPMGPLLPGAGMNITVMSHVDRLDVGVMACPDLVEDVWEVTTALPHHLDALAEALGVLEAQPSSSSVAMSSSR